MDSTDLLIGIVGPCKSGKTELKLGLEKLGYRCRHIAQEHSYAPAMWQIIANPDLLIFLDATYPVTVARGELNWTEKEYQEQRKRLYHALAHADLYIDTVPLTIQEVLDKAASFIQSVD
jgi:hypothetical protein